MHANNGMEDKQGHGSTNLQDRSLSQKVSKGAAWVTATAVVTRGFYFITAIIMARLLLPSDFGLMAIAMSIITFTQGTTDTGFLSALIQKQDKTEEFLNTAWTIELVRYIILAMVLFFTAPLLSIYFAEPNITPVLRVLSVSVIIQGLRNVGIIFFRKNLQFDKQFVVEVVPLITNIVLVIPLAYILRSVWALVLTTLATSIVTCLVSYAIHPYRPRLEFNRQKCKELLGFGKWIFGQSIIGVFLNQAVNMFIGKFYAMTNLGFYDRALTFSSTILQQIDILIWKIAYPLYSQLQSEPERLKKAYLNTAYFLYFVGLPMAGGLFILSKDFVYIFLRDEWLPIVPLMQILCLKSAIETINTPSIILFQAIGKPSIGAKRTTLTLILTALMIYPLSSLWGLSGTVFSLFLSNLIVSPMILYTGSKIIESDLLEFIRPLLFSITSTGMMIAIIYMAKVYLLHEIKIYEFIGLIVIGIISYFIITLVLERFFHYGLRSLIKERLVAFKH